MSLQPLFELLAKLQRERDTAYEVLSSIQATFNDNDNTLAIGENLPIAKI